MKTKIIILILVIAVNFAASCKKEPKPEPPEPPAPITLINTNWKLVAFADVETGVTQEPQRFADKCYHIKFSEDTTFSGFSSNTKIGGTYIIDKENSKIKISLFFGIISSSIFEILDGKQYIEALNNVQSFSFQDEELKLYYNDNKNYLLFKSNPTYNDSDPLLNTSWRLKGYVDVATSQIELVEWTDLVPHMLNNNFDKNYMITIFVPSKIEGNSVYNWFSAKYVSDETTANMTITADGWQYDWNAEEHKNVDALNDVHKFSLEGNELKLYYNNGQNYLLYIKYEL